MTQRIVLLLAVVFFIGCASSPDLTTLAEWRAKADKAYQEGQYPTALQYYQKLSKAAPSEADIWFRLGNTHARMDQTDEAVKAYREAVLRDNHFAKAWYNAGFNQLRASAQTFSEALRYLPPSDPIFQIAKSYNQQLLQLMEQQNQALEKLSKSKEESKPLDVKKVEMIVLDGKPQKISDLPPVLMPDQTSPEALEAAKIEQQQEQEQEVQQHSDASQPTATETTSKPDEKKENPKGKEDAEKNNLWHPPLLKATGEQAAQ